MKWLADECFDNDIIRGLLRRSSDLDLIRAQDVSEIAGRDDEKLLARATENERVVLTHDVTTMVPALLLQWRQASRCAPVVLVPDSLPIGQR
jgi:predicted nuclease of predicted toxin-antitoxin system